MCWLMCSHPSFNTTILYSRGAEYNRHIDAESTRIAMCADIIAAPPPCQSYCNGREEREPRCAHTLVGTWRTARPVHAGAATDESSSGGQACGARSSREESSAKTPEVFRAAEDFTARYDHGG